ncbi:MFS transporter [Acetatifactor aquisgranensis]|uniref:MFS transporter n=1 Tax=Acetatifactor aquisgranensis TaxID=2941233 RepID=UPI00203FAD53|nr:MFS transporter [Acetatifactor aquisgranensis]
MESKGKNRKFWAALFIFSLTGQVAWVVENMYFNVFIYKMFHATAADISLMVGASSVAATVTTILVGAFTDYVGKRKAFICGGYLAWGVSILAFAFLRVDLLTPLAGSALRAASLGIALVIVMDCVMTFLGSSANDACFNAWMTDWGDGGNRGKIEGINSMMPLVAILVVFGGFSAFDLDRAGSWTAIYLIVGAGVMLIGVAGAFLIEEKPKLRAEREQGYWGNLSYSFRVSVMKANPLLYAVIGAFAVFGISINIFMPYLILYYEKTLGMANYVAVMAPAIVLAAVITAFYGKLYDLLGFKTSVVPAVVLLMAGYVVLYAGRAAGVVFLGSLLMMTGYLTGMAVFGAMIRSNIPEQRAGQFQGIRIIGQVLIPGIVGPAMGAFVLRDADTIINSDGTASFLPNGNIFLAALAAAAVTLAALGLIFRMMRRGHHRLMSRCGERLLGEMKRGESTADISERDGTASEGTGTKSGSGRSDAGAADVKKPGHVWDSYPRPQMRRESYLCLNGVWNLNGQSILVPFPPQSQLSGYQGRVGTKLVYEKTFALSEEFLAQKAHGKRVLLHFGAVDQMAEVFLNGHFAGRHEGGYLPFWFDVTEYLEDGENRLLVKAEDTLSALYPYGKQRKARGGMWYTPVSGIWQSVWMECVPQAYIERLDVTADTRNVRIAVVSSTGGGVRGMNGGLGDVAERPDCADRESDDISDITVTIKLHDGSLYTVRAGKDSDALEIDLARIRLGDGSEYQPLLWTPEHPYLYEMTVAMGEDRVTSYFGLRTIEVKQIGGIPKVCLNGNPIFLHGVLDQGYFCDGLYLPAEAEEYEQDILRMKELGINLLRKHIKIEPECFYHYCDVHGMMVMQDMVNNGRYSWVRDTALPTVGVSLKNAGRLGNRKRKEFFRQHMKDTILHLRNHPGVISYTIFNEGWGQFDSDAIYQEAKSLDGTRLYDAASGWFAGERSDFDSQHIYFKRLVVPKVPDKPVLISECGGYSWRVPEHFYAKYAGFGYGDCADREELTEQIGKLYRERVLPVIPKGVCGCIYTQLSDVEDETNGLYTYDRKVCKVNGKAMREIAGKLEEAVFPH